MSHPGAALDRFHAACSAADEAACFQVLHPRFAFLGTDATERWELQAFREFASARFREGRGWTYHTLERHLEVVGDVAWFDERLAHDTWGEARSSGVLLRVDGSWLLAQYVLSFPVPNALAPEILGRIRAAGDGGGSAG